MKKLSYVDEEGNKGECTLTEFIEYETFDGHINMTDQELLKLKTLKIDETVRVEGFMGCFTDVTRIK